MQQEIQKSLSCRKVSVRHLPIIVSDGTVNERKSSGRYPTKTFGYDKHFYINGHNGFTLIELLVVVLIIGILAAVALPQYQKAVEKSRATQALTLLKSVYNAAKAYQLANGEWPQSFDELAVEIPWTGTTNGISIGAHHKQGKSNADWSIQILNSNAEGKGVVVTRLSGLYTGGSFRIYSVPGHPQYGPDELLCVEMVGGSVATAYKFKKSKGNYCQKIMKATLVHTLSEGSWNYFRMP